jgi:two-component system, OmpR family, sensor histidine kinase BaeS
MFKSLSWKITLAFILVALASAGLVALFIHFTNADRLSQFVIEQQRSDIEKTLEDYYVANGSWGSVQNDWQQIQAEAAPESPSSPAGVFPPGKGKQFGRERRSFFGLVDDQGVVLIPPDPNHPIGSKLTSTELKVGIPLFVQGKQVGTILTMQKHFEFSPEESLFLERTNHALMLATLLALIGALLIGMLLSRSLTKPLRELTLATRKIAGGHLEQQVPVTSKDEIGQLASSFNLMSREVAQANQLRRQMTADIAHDLRTPLTVIGGYVESMRDGVLKPTEERLSLIYAEILRLQDMVGDLRLLSQADAGELPLNPQRISPKALVDRAAALFQHQAEKQQITLTAMAENNLPDIYVDEARMLQVMDNLLSNAFRYTPAGGRIELLARRTPGKVEINVKDNGSGIAPEELPFIFDRFHRADKSRHTEAGESGLGLAIVKALIEAHGGRVRAESSPGDGTVICMELNGL